MSEQPPMMFGMPPFPPVPPGPQFVQMYDGVPVGAVIAFAGVVSGPPRVVIERWGWMPCDGTQLTVAEYPELFAAIGYIYGGKKDTFVLPDYRGVFLRGVDDRQKINGKENPALEKRQKPKGGQGQQNGVGSIQLDAFQTHRHPYNEPTNQGNFGNAKAPAVQSITPKIPTGDPINSQKGNTIRTSELETRAKNVFINFIIKYRSLNIL